MNEIMNINGVEYRKLKDENDIPKSKQVAVEELNYTIRQKDKEIKDLRRYNPFASLIIKRQKELVKSDLGEYEIKYRLLELKELMKLFSEYKKELNK